ncbi:unnamed protein product [Mucor hiemalis]
MIGQNIRIGSLNARSMFKVSYKITQREFASYLRAQSLGLDILCLQEVSHFHSQVSLSDDQIRSFSFLFPRCSFVVSKHCAIVCLKPGLSLADTDVALDERLVVASVMDAQQNVLCRVASLYVPVQSSDRPQFLDSFLSLSLWSEVFNTPWILAGDFNMRLHSSPSVMTSNSSLSSWYDWLRLHFNNCFPDGSATFPRAGTTIDYIFGHTSLVSRLVNPQNHYLPVVWTDHCLLTIDLLPSRMDIGPGCWRFNPVLLNDSSFVELLDMTLDIFFDSFGDDVGVGVANSSSSGEGEPRNVQKRWESLKLILKSCTQRYTRSAKSRFKNKVASLQQERMMAVSSSDMGSVASGSISDQRTGDSSSLERVHELEKLLDSQIQKETRQNMLRSATRWQEMGERNNKYFYRVIKERQSQQTIQSLRCSSTGEVLVEAADILREARGFYQKLYTPEDIEVEAIDSLLDSVPSGVKVSSDAAGLLVLSPDRDTVLSLLAYAPKDRSPGLDGIPFEVYKYLASRPKSDVFIQLLTDVLHDALLGVFPDSWQQTRMVLLFKKGDPLSLGNWRPLSLINSDAKLFTKLLANRFKLVLPGLINPFQTGFLPDRLISDNGWLNQTIMSNLRSAAPDVPSVAVLLDQEKAYDRVHPEYLRRVMLRFGFPSGLVSCLCSLFFGTRISLSINGWLGEPIPQLRGLRQGDPLSPLLFNLAFEPLLRSILASSSFSGVGLAPVSVPRSWCPDPASVLSPSGELDWFLDRVSDVDPPPPLKLLSYADDLEVFLSSPDEWPELLSLLDLYGRASNAKVNLNKTVLVSLSGVAHPEWVSIASRAGLEWHDSSSADAVRYLGYPLYSSDAQLNQFLDAIKVKVMRHANILSGRHLSIRGAGLVANSLLLSKVWHLLRVVPVPDVWLKDIQKIVRKYLLHFWPAPSWSTLCLRRKHGGVGVVDLFDQSLALQLVYIQRLLPGSFSSTDFVSPWLVHCLQMYTGHDSILPVLMFPSAYKCRFSSLPTLARLVKLLIRLPKLLLSSSWSARWFLDLPLRCILRANSDVTSTPSIDVSSIPMRYLLSDIVCWSIGAKVLSGISAPTKSLLRRIWSDVVSGALVLPTLIRSCIAFDVDTLFSTSSAPIVSASTLLPSCFEWYIPTGFEYVVRVARVPLGTLRQYWHPLSSLLGDRLGPPMQPPFALLLRPFFWRKFWSLALPAKAFTPWWRLLLNSIGYRARLHRWNAELYDSPLCAFCSAPETLFHFVVGCPVKYNYWHSVMQHLEMVDIFPSELAIWSGLVTLCSLNRKPLKAYQLVLLGSAFSTLWAYHWRCVLDAQLWSSAGVLNLFLQDHKLLISDYLKTHSNSLDM